MAPVVAFLLLISIISFGVKVSGITMITDQQCSTIGGGYLNGIGAYPPAGQTFKATQTSIVGFSINVWSTNGVPTPMTAKILSGGVGGAVVGSTMFSIPMSFGLPTGAWFDVQFSSGIQLTPGSIYAIDLTDNLASSGIKWNGCSTPYADGAGYSSGSYGTPPIDDWSFIEYAGDFSISPTPGSLSIVQGSSGSVSVSISSLSNFASPVTLSFSGALGVTGTFGANPVTPPAGGSTSSSLGISVAGSVAPGVYLLTVGGTSGPLSHSASISLTVTPAALPDFSIASSSPTIALNQGGSNSATITVISINGFNSAVTLSPSWVGTAPTGVTFTLPGPITPPSGSSASSTLTVSAGATSSTGTFTLRVTGTSGSILHFIDISIQIAAVTMTTSSTSSVAVPDFSLGSSPSSISIAQGGSGTATVTVTSLNGFTSPVALSGSWVGSAPANVNYALTSPVTPPSGGTASSPLTITAGSGASTGTFTLRVTGSSGSLSHTVDITIQITVAGTSTTTTAPPPGGGCLIATATYGSELSPEVQLLRGFRDNQILKTVAGSGFMTAFNTWYYSFSPNVAGYLNNHVAERTVMKGVLYPLMGILFVSSRVFSATSTFPELAAVLSGLLATFLIGGVYVGLPLGLIRVRIHRFRASEKHKKLEEITAASLLVGLAGILLGELATFAPLMTVSTSATALAAVFLGALVTSGVLPKLVLKSHRHLK